MWIELSGRGTYPSGGHVQAVVTVKTEALHGRYAEAAKAAHAILGDALKPAMGGSGDVG